MESDKMDFIDQLKQFSQRVEGLKDNIQTEEATKTAIIMPFFALLGYDVFNPSEFIPEYTADVGIKKGEKVDYAIVVDDEPTILIEAKWIGENLQKHDSQLFRYFGTSKAKFAILTNGRYYRFFTDLEEPNKMDEKPFLEIDILDIKENQVSELKKFHKSSFNLSEIFDIASDLKYSNQFKAVFNNQLQEPKDEFVKFFLQDVYTGMKTQSVIDRFRPILKKTLNNYISELMNDKIKSALGTENATTVEVNADLIVETENIEVNSEPKVITTEEELEAYFIIKNLLKDTVPMKSITFKDNERYSTILYNNKSINWVCRLVLKDNKKTLILPDENKKEIKHILDNVYDIENYKDKLIAVLNRYI